VDFQLSDEQRMLQETVRDFADRECRPLASAWDREARLPDERVLRQMVEMGLFGMCLPQAYGGGGQELLSAILCIEQLARISPLCAAGVFESNVGPVRVVEKFGSEEQRERFLPLVCQGKMQISVGMTEAEAGSALTDLRTKAEPCADGWRLNGRKVFCTGGGHSEAYLVYCRFGETPGARGIGALLVEKGTPGFSFGKQEEYMGLRGLPGSDLVFEDCVVSEANLVVRAGGFRSLMECFDIERCGNATMALGIASGALEVARDHALERRTFGRPIAERQAIQMLIADMATRVDAARLLVYRAAANAGRGFPSVQETSMAKVFANETAKAVTDMAMEVLGGYGYSTEYPVERMLRDSRGWPLAGGTLQIQKIIIASTVLGRRFDQRH
jgi:butyryl-CoA dehydrogenase